MNRAAAPGAVDAVVRARPCKRGAAQAAGALLGLAPGAGICVQAHGHRYAQPLLLRARAAVLPPLQGLRCEYSSLAPVLANLLGHGSHGLIYGMHLGLLRGVQLPGAVLRQLHTMAKGRVGA